MCRRRRKKNDPEEPKDHALGRSRGGFFDENPYVVRRTWASASTFAWTPGQQHESTAFLELLDRADEQLKDGQGEPIAWPDALAGDKGYRANRIDEGLDYLGIAPVIPSKQGDHDDRRKSTI